ncbi:hypothetical protein E1N52_18815 [Paraburkholderia guartelaensis]|uniref:Uncharacterized protein n=1 Tax=Paraburkholderia guartelaensis TaxID=2546446 RepID=A0A4R5LEF4_9BURK|nr:hypothetical protein [Paraburkholderia guartelaensis]TDG06841.1 hypothetical protein E1N52_18815 [Paraburkholderia guartelaensis]
MGWNVRFTDYRGYDLHSETLECPNEMWVWRAKVSRGTDRDIASSQDLETSHSTRDDAESAGFAWGRAMVDEILTG